MTCNQERTEPQTDGKMARDGNGTANIRCGSQGTSLEGKAN